MDAERIVHRLAITKDALKQDPLMDFRKIGMYRLNSQNAVIQLIAVGAWEYIKSAKISP